MKLCSRCKKELSLDSFYRYNDRYQSTCNPCKTDYNKQEYSHVQPNIVQVLAGLLTLKKGGI